MLILARHGRTAANAGGLLQGRIDLPLDEVGERQAAALASALGRVDRVIASPLLRARHTAEAFGLPVEVDERWIELDYGALDNSPDSAVPAEVRTAWRGNAAFRPEGGESLEDVAARVRPACEELIADAMERDVVVVSHVSPMKAALAWALGVGLGIAWRSHLAPASVCRIVTSGPQPVLLSFNETPAAAVG